MSQRTQTHYDYVLGIDEFMAAISLSGRSAEANGLLKFAMGDISLDEKRGRFIAGHNSLYAKNLIFTDTSSKQIILEPGLLNILEIIFTPGNLVRSNKGGLFGENILTFYKSNKNWLAHTVLDGIVHKFKFPFSLEDAVISMSQFLEPDFSGMTRISPLELPADLFSHLNSQGGQFSENFLSFLSSHSVNNKTAQLLEKDFASAKWRGTTIWMDQSIPKKVVTRGTFWIQGDQRLWMVHSNQDSISHNFTASLVEPSGFPSYLKSLFQSL
jgi:hypothetical protein